MKKLFFLLALICFGLGLGCYGDYGEKKASKTSDSGGSAVSLPEGPLVLPEGANSEANRHNEEGISHYKEGHYDVALKHFREASAIDTSTGEVHFNEAIALDRLGDHGGATEHFKVAQQKANGSTLILESNILLKHVQ
jgi:tetratricopeptide (TPR) repeat protein